MPQFLHHHLFDRQFQFTEMNELYISLSLRAFAMGIAGIFVPIYLFDLGYSLMVIAGFFLVASVVRLFANVPVGVLVGRYGPKHVLTLSYGLLTTYFLLLYAAPRYPLLVAAAAVVVGLETCCFWLSRHFDFSQSRSRQTGSSQVGAVIIWTRLAAAIGPLAGGVIATQFGVGYALLLAALALVVAIYPLFKTEDRKTDTAFSLKRFRWLRIPKDATSYVGMEFSTNAAMLVWPLYVFLVVGTYQSLGFILSTSLVLGVGLAYWVGKLGDKGYNAWILKVGALVMSLAHLLRLTAIGFVSVLLVNALSDVADYFIKGPFTQSYYNNADHHNRINYTVNMQIWGDVGRVLLWLALLVLAAAFSTVGAIFYVFALAGLSTLVIPLITAPTRR